jgi:hypothetical protein
MFFTEREKPVNHGFLEIQRFYRKPFNGFSVMKNLSGFSRKPLDVRYIYVLCEKPLGVFYKT